MHTTTQQINQHCNQIASKAKALGFSRPFPITEPHKFYHPDINKIFNLAAIDPDKILLAIWQAGVKYGQRISK